MKVLIYRIASRQVINNIKNLYPEWEIAEKVEDYYRSKIRYCLLIVAAGTLIALITLLFKGNSEFDGRNQIKRPSYGETKKMIMVEAKTGDGRYESETEIEVSERRYSKEALDEMLPEFRRRLINAVLSGNESADYIVKNMNFVGEIEGYPFKVTYRTDKPLVLSSNGIISQENLLKTEEVEDGVTVKVIANISYFDYEEDFSFYVRVYPEKKAGNELFESELKKKLKKADINSIEEEFYYLPEEILGEKITIREKDTNEVFIILIITGMTAIAVFFMKDKDLCKLLEEKNRRLALDYPAFVNRFTLFYCAGIPVKNIWMKLCSEYETVKKSKGETNTLYEEMLITRKQILEGMHETDAYIQFGERVNIQKYKVFVNLICQAVRVGKGDLNEMLKIECSESFAERRNNARRLLEEASTKLLIPLFMMLIVVILIVMFPAFMSFRS